MSLAFHVAACVVRASCGRSARGGRAQCNRYRTMMNRCTEFESRYDTWQGMAEGADKQTGTEALTCRSVRSLPCEISLLLSSPWIVTCCT